MAIDSSVFGADLPAGTYTKGDVIQLGNIAGPAVVRSGRGAAYLKRVTSAILDNSSAALSYWKISVKNSDWVDSMMSLTASIRDLTALDERSGCIQRGNNCPLTPNSSWEVVAECVATVTTTAANSIFALIDIDYPSVSAIADSDALTGIPASIEYSAATVNLHAMGNLATSNWNVVNVDIFKAGFEYALQKIEYVSASTATTGFIALANAAGMGGLCRIIPITNELSAIKNKVEYATKLQKGPMDIKYLLFAGSNTTDTPNVIFDFVKRRI